MIIYFNYGVKHSRLETNSTGDANIEDQKVKPPTTLNVPQRVVVGNTDQENTSSNIYSNNSTVINPFNGQQANITTNPFVEHSAPRKPPPIPPRPSFDRQDTTNSQTNRSFSSSSPFGPIYDVNQAWGDE